MKSNAYLNGQDILNWYKTPSEMTFSKQGFPELEPLKSLDIPRRGLPLVPFNYALSNKNKDCYIHFYIQDYLFNRIWNNPQRYIDVLKDYKGIVMPDFSLYTDMPEPLQRFNHYRNLWFARMCQIQGITVIPSPNWSTMDSFDWCLEGMPKESILMISSVGSVKNPQVFEEFVKGLQIAQDTLLPTYILVRSTQKSYRDIKSFINTACSFVPYVV